MVANNTGALFVYNPTSFPLPFSFSLDRALGFDSRCLGPIEVSATASSNRAFSPFKMAVLQCGAEVNVTVPPTTALSFEFHAHHPQVYHDYAVFGGAAVAKFDTRTRTLLLTHAHGPAGQAARLTVVEPIGGSNLSHVRYVTVNGAQPIAVDVRQDCVLAVRSGPLCVEQVRVGGLDGIRVVGRWRGAPFSNQIGSMTAFKGGRWSANFSVPSAVLAQLRALNRSYPLQYDTDPQGDNDPNVPWLAPGRLLVFVKYKPLLSDKFDAVGAIDGRAIVVRKGYNTIVPSPAR